MLEKLLGKDMEKYLKQILKESLLGIFNEIPEHISAGLLKKKYVYKFLNKPLEDFLKKPLDEFLPAKKKKTTR